MQPEPDARTTVEQLLGRELSPRQFIVELVHWLDVRITAEPEGCEREVLARAVIASGHLLLPRMPTVDHTLEAARSFIAEPTVARYDALQLAATSSYPFGPGDGCHAVGECNGTLGNGCRTGAGCLASVAETVGYDATADAIRNALREWLDSD